MGKKSRAARSLLRAVERSSLRSSLFWWMHDYHDAIVKAAKGHPIRWADFRRNAERLGLTDTKGRVPSERNTRETWLQVRKAVAAERAAAAGYPSPKQRAPYPSHVARIWKPTEVPKSGVPALSLASEKAVAPVKQGQREPYDPEKGLAYLDEQLKGRSGR